MYLLQQKIIEQTKEMENKLVIEERWYGPKERTKDRMNIIEMSSQNRPLQSHRKLKIIQHPARSADKPIVLFKIGNK